MSERFNVWCRISFDLAFLFIFLFVLIFPFHQRATRHFNVTRTLDATHIEFLTGPNSAPAIGDELPVYRFNPDWRLELGKVTVDQVQDGRVVCSFNPRNFRWPMGRHGRIIEHPSADQVGVDLGRSLGFKTGDRLVVFKERLRVGSIELTEVSEHQSRARVLGKIAPALLGLTVTEYTVATQVVHFRNWFLSLVEWIGILAVGCGYVFFYRKHGQSPFLTYGPWVLGRLKAFYRIRGVRFSLQLLAGWFVVWFGSNFIMNTLIFLFQKGTHWLHRFSGMTVFLPNLQAKSNVIPLYLIGGFLIGVYLLKTKRSPVLDCWDLFRVKGPGVNWLKGVWRDGVIWFLQGIIFYAFGANLIFFIGGNINEIARIAWPSLDRGMLRPFDPWDLGSIVVWIRQVFQVVGYMVTHPADFWSTPILFLIIRYVLWTVTCISCLMAYLHSVVSFFWGYRLRNLDFTVMGWITNGICYPLLGFLIWPMVPPMVGAEPTITGGPWFYFMFFLDFFLNLLYTLSIWNLGLLFGVMTDKGVRTSGFYSVIRHPNYTLEAPMFLFVAMIGMTTPVQWFSASMWILIYYIRSEREDHFMSRSNPNYLEYRKQTPYKFIPGIY